MFDNGSGVDVFGSEDTRINGELGGVASFGRVYGDLRISMKRGDNIVLVADVGNATFAEADGQDGKVLGRIKIWGGYGSDTLAIAALDDSSPILYGLSVYAGPGADCVYVYGVDTVSRTSEPCRGRARRGVVGGRGAGALKSLAAWSAGLIGSGGQRCLGHRQEGAGNK